MTISHTRVLGENNAYWIAVGNQSNEPTLLYGGEKLASYPKKESYKIDIDQPDTVDKERFIQLFKLNTTSVALAYAKLLDEYNCRNGGAAQVRFCPGGKELAVATWDVPHFLTDDPKLKEMRPNRVYIYDLENGTAGIDWAPNSEIIYASNFSMLNDKGDHRLTVLHDRKTMVNKIDNRATGNTPPKDFDEACWTVMSPKGDMLYVVSYVTNVITPFKLVAASGKVLDRMPLSSRGEGFNPGSDVRNALITPDGNFMYCLGSFASYSINLYGLNADGSAVFNGQHTLKATKNAVEKPGVYDLGGIAAYELN